MTAEEEAIKKVEGMFGGGEEPASETPAETEPPEAEAQGEEGAEAAPPAEAQPEETEVEIEGERYLIPKKIADRFIQHADYTRKTQDIAELRRTLTSQVEAAAVEKAFEKAVADDRKHLGMLEAQIEQYRKLDWGSLETEQLLKARAQLDQLKDAAKEVDESIKGKRGEFDERIKQLSQEALTSGQKYVEQHVKGWSDTTKQELFAYGLNEGYTRDEMDRIVDPRIVVTMWKARQWDALQASKPELQKRANKPVPVVKPGPVSPQPNRAQAFAKSIKEAKTPKEKARATENYFAAKFGG